MPQSYTSEFKKKIVRLHEEEGRTYKSITAEYGVSKASISSEPAIRTLQKAMESQTAIKGELSCTATRIPALLPKHLWNTANLYISHRA